jgi:fatty acyl-CoA reductase
MTMEYSPIQEFYLGKSIFITGSTGFLGKLLMQKLCTTCIGFKSIYLLVRPKKDVSVHQRIEEIFNNAVSI